MSKRLPIILALLVLMTLGGLVLVSNLISEKSGGSDSAAAQGSPVTTPRALQTPSVRRSATGAQRSADLARAQSQLLELTEVIKALDWTRAQVIFSGFDFKEKRLPAPQLRHPDVSPLLQDFFDFYVVQLDRAISEKQPKQAGVALSQLMGIIDETASRFGAHGLPVEVQRLHYLLREVVIWKDAGDEQMLQARKVALSEAWNDVSSLARARQDGDRVAQSFTEVLNQVMAADSPQKLTPLLGALRDRLKDLDGLFDEQVLNEE